MASKAALYPRIVSARFLKRTFVRYLLCLCFLIVPAALTPILLSRGKSLSPIVSGLYLLAVAAAGWWGGTIAGILVSFALVPVFTLTVTHGKAILPPHLNIPAMFVLCGVAVLTGQVAGARRRAEKILRLANEQLEERVKERTAELEHARSWLETTLASIGDAVIATDHQGKVLFMNAMAEDLTGWTQREALGRPLAEVFVIRNEYRDVAADDPVGKVLATGAISGFANHTVLVSRHGRRIPIDDSAAPIRSGEAGLTGVVLVFRDVTERREIERLAEDARKQLEQNNQELQQFAYAASHDLQEPLRNLVIYTQLLKRKHSDQLSTDASRIVQSLTDGAMRMNSLLNDLLAYTQIWSTTEGVVPSDLRHVFEAVVSSLGATIEATGAKVDCGDLPVLRMNEVHLQQLLQNLVGNALKYRSEAPPVILVDCKRAGGDWKVSVADNGIGIDPVYKEKIFEPFKRLHDKEKYPGTGVGLALCQKIVQRYGGRIWVESEPGKGATFFFTVPVEEFRAT